MGGAQAVGRGLCNPVIWGAPASSAPAPCSGTPGSYGLGYVSCCPLWRRWGRVSSLLLSPGSSKGGGPPSAQAQVIMDLASHHLPSAAERPLSSSPPVPRPPQAGALVERPVRALSLRVVISHRRLPRVLCAPPGWAVLGAQPMPLFLQVMALCIPTRTCWTAPASQKMLRNEPGGSYRLVAGTAWVRPRLARSQRA